MSHRYLDGHLCLYLLYLLEYKGSLVRGVTGECRNPGVDTTSVVSLVIRPSLRFANSAFLPVVEVVGSKT